MAKYLFVTGGVVSSLGKGITISSIAALLKAAGYTKIKLKKLDPYLNVDPGTMNPFEHGEVFVTKDGKETDLDLGNYERFTQIETDQHSNITSGQLFQTLLQKERQGEFLGKTVQIVPHLTNEIKQFITQDSDKYDFILIEIGGTIGDLEAAPILEAVRQLKYELPSTDSLSFHVTLIPYIRAAKELKTKPTQHSVKELMSIGIAPDFLICRTERKLKPHLISKIAKYCNVHPDSVIEAHDVKSIYEVPLKYAKQNLTSKILSKLNLPINQPNLTSWITLNNQIISTKTPATITIVGKYVPYDDAYISLVEAIKHAAWSLSIKPEIQWIDSRDESDITSQLEESTVVIVPGGFGRDGIQTKLNAITYCRENNKPILGICLGMQLMILEYAKNVMGLDATTEELTSDQQTQQTQTKTTVVGFLDNWIDETDNKVHREKTGDKGGTMRLGNYTTLLTPDTKTYSLYNAKTTVERHRHRYEVKLSPEILNRNGLTVSGSSKDDIPEIVEITDHPYFIGCQFHPEYRSTPFTPRPLFTGLLQHI